MRRCKSYRIAQCGMSTALAIIILAFGHNLGIGEFFWYYVASLLIDLPEHTIDKVLCFLATSLLAAVLCGFNLVYLAAFCLLMAPYVLTKAFACDCSSMFQYWVVTIVSFLGLMAVCWWTPMFFLQISSIHSQTIRWISIFIILVVSLVFEPLYGRLYNAGKQILLKVWFRIA